MNSKHMMRLAAMTSAVFLSGAVMAADAGHSVTQMQDNATGKAPMQSGAMTRAESVGGTQRFDNTHGAAGFDTWMNDYAASHNGRVTRQEFLDQMGNRWDSLDAQRRGYMSPDEARGVYMGDQDARRPALSGSDVKQGYTGPGNSKK